MTIEHASRIWSEHFPLHRQVYTGPLRDSSSDNFVKPFIPNATFPYQRFTLTNRLMWWILCIVFIYPKPASRSPNFIFPFRLSFIEIFTNVGFIVRAVLFFVNNLKSVQILRVEVFCIYHTVQRMLKSLLTHALFKMSNSSNSCTQHVVNAQSFKIMTISIGSVCSKVTLKTIEWCQFAKVCFLLTLNTSHSLA